MSSNSLFHYKLVNWNKCNCLKPNFLTEQYIAGFAVQDEHPGDARLADYNKSWI